MRRSLLLSLTALIVVAGVCLAAPALAGAATFSNSGTITIPAAGTSGPAAPYPSTIDVSGLVGPITDVNVTLTGFNHTAPDDVDVLLVGPGGQSVILMSDAGAAPNAVNLTFTFDDKAAGFLPETGALASGTYQPSNWPEEATFCAQPVGSTIDTFPAPAPAGPYGSTLAAFDGTSANGTWSLYVVDDCVGDLGSISGGWSLDITTPDATPPVTTIAPDPSSPDGSNGWYTSNSVGASIAATDAGGSGVAETRCALDPASAPASFEDLPSGSCSLTSVSGDGPHTIYAASKDNQGNAESPVVSTSVKIDSTPPTLSPSVSPSPLYLHASGASVSANASDQTSGVDQSTMSCDPVDTSTAGDHTLTCYASDNAGNQASATAHYTVEYNLLGFYSPVPGSKWKAGATVPVKIALADVNGVRISDSDAAALLSPTCRVKFSASGAQKVNATCMKYDPATHQFVFNWKLGKATGSETITVTISYPGTTTTTTKSQTVTISK